jgi:hypothetical protein
MIIDVPYLLLALALLWFPRQWMRLGATVIKRRRSASQKLKAMEPWRAREAGDPRISFSREFTRFRNYLDLLRGAAGSVLLLGAWGIAACVRVDPGASSMAGKQVLAVRSTILIVGLLLQTFRIERRRVTFYPPIFYVAGLSLGLSKPFGAAFAFLMIWAMNPAMGNAQAFLTMYALLIVVFGYLFGAGLVWPVFAGFLAFLPVLLSLLSKRPLVMLARKATHAGG